MGTIFVAGTYGVGKSTLCKNLSQALNIPDYSAGDLISAINGEMYGDNKIVTDKVSNQDILRIQVKKILKHTPRILLAGHFCIFDKCGNVDYLPDQIFHNLNIDSILLLEAPISRIIKNLKQRDNKNYSEQQIIALQIAESVKAHEIATQLGCVLHLHNMTFNESDTDNCTSYLQGEKEI